jgi:hypothetical protein
MRVPGCVADQVGQRALQQAHVGRAPCGIAVDTRQLADRLPPWPPRAVPPPRPQRRPGCARVSRRASAPRSACDRKSMSCTIIDMRWSSSRCEPSTSRSVVGVARLAQSDFGASHQRRQRREQFMRNVGIEGFQLFVGPVQTLQQLVDMLPPAEPVRRVERSHPEPVIRVSASSAWTCKAEVRVPGRSPICTSVNPPTAITTDPASAAATSVRARRSARDRPRWCPESAPPGWEVDAVRGLEPHVDQR